MKLILFIFLITIKFSSLVKGEDILEIEFLPNGVIHSELIVPYDELDEKWFVNFVANSSKNHLIILRIDLKAGGEGLIEKVLARLHEKKAVYLLSVKVGHKYYGHEVIPYKKDSRNEQQLNQKDNKPNQ